MEPVHIIGAGLAGSEAAWQVARAGVPVTLHEMRPAKGTFAHKTGDCAEMVCWSSIPKPTDIKLSESRGFRLQCGKRCAKPPPSVRSV